MTALEDGANSAVLDAYNQKIDDLQEERRQARWFNSRMFPNSRHHYTDTMGTDNDDGSIDRNHTRDVRRRRSND